MSNSLKFIPKQKAYLSPKMAHSIKLLNMSAFDMNQYIEKEIEENPVIDKVDVNINDEISKQSDDYVDKLSSKNNGIKLSDHIMNQLKDSIKTRKQEDVIKYIVYSLDSNGYFQPKKTDLRILNCSSEFFNDCLKMVQSCEPHGVARHDLSDSLIYQLRKKDNNRIAIKIVKNFLKELANNENKKIKNALNINDEELSNAKALIRSCNPRPSNGFSNNENVQYIIPEIQVERNNESIIISERKNVFTQFTFSEYYLNLYQKTSEEETKEYLKRCINKANNLQYFISHRNATLLKVASAIILYQKDYFLSKDITELKSLNMKEIAEMIGISISTVSRAVKDKYIVFDNEILKLSYLIRKKVNRHNNKTPELVKKRIKSILYDEDNDRFLSDMDIVNKLNREKIIISRRTITKYRKELGIESSFKRKANNED